MPNVYHPTRRNLQLIWDSTSLRKLQTCPRKYQLSQLEGWGNAKNVHLEFGIMFQEGVEIYQNEVALGVPHDTAQLHGLRNLFDRTVEHAEDDPWVQTATPGLRFWGGDWLIQWRCEGTEPYKNAKGNKAKCPYSHVGKWFFGDAPSTCGECGSATEEAVHWVSHQNNIKHRYSLLTAYVYATEYIHENPVTIITLPNGEPAVEVNAVVPFGMATDDGHDYLISINLDEVCSLGGETWIVDNKTTEKSLGKWYFKQYDPDIQVDLYDAVGSMLLADHNIQGVMIRAIQVTGDNADVTQMPFRKTEEYREEFWADLSHWIKMAALYEEQDYWPQNRAACQDCLFRTVCSRPAKYQQQVLEADFERRFWNPVERRTTNER